MLLASATLLVARPVLAHPCSPPSHKIHTCTVFCIQSAKPLPRAGTLDAATGSQRHEYLIGHRLSLSPSLQVADLPCYILRQPKSDNVITRPALGAPCGLTFLLLADQQCLAGLLPLPLPETAKTTLTLKTQKQLSAAACNLPVSHVVNASPK